MGVITRKYMGRTVKINLPEKCPRCGGKSFFNYPPSAAIKCSSCGWTPSREYHSKGRK